MANHISHASLPFPVKNARFTVLVPFLDADGDPTDPTTPDTEVSQDGGAFADAAEEVTTISGSNGLGYVTLTGAEMNNSAVGVAFKVASGPKATLMTLYPRVLPVLESGTAQAGAAGTITLAAGASACDLSGCIVRTTGGTGGGGTGGANNQARMITAYNTGTKVATVVPNWETNPSSDTTYDILTTDLAGFALKANATCIDGAAYATHTAGYAPADVRQYGGSAGTFASGRPEVNTTHAAGTAWGSGAITAASIAADAITAAKVADGTIDAATFAAGAINAAAIAADAITDAKVAADVTIASVTGSVGSVTGAVGSVTGNVGGNVTGSVGSVATGGIAAASFAAGAINAAAIATDAIDGDAIAASAVSEIQSGLATASALATVQADTDDIQARLPAALVGGRIDASVGAMAAGVVTASAIATDAIDADALAADAVTEIQAGLSTLDAAGVRSAVGLASANLDTQLSGINSKTTNLPADPADASDIAALFAAIPDAVWDEALAGHLTAGSTGAALNAAGAAGDPWSTAIPGAYGAGTAGKIVGDSLDAAVSSRASAAAVAALPTAAGNADAVWDEARAGHVAAGSFGEGVASVQGAVTGSVASVTADVGITQTGADKVWASAARTLTSFGSLVADTATAVWGAAVRVLTAGTNIVLAKGVGVTGFNDLSAAQVNAEADTALADAGVTTTVTGRIDATVSSRLAAASYTAPDNAGIATAVAGAAAIFARTDVATSTRAAPGDAMTLTAGERGSVADKFLGRNIAGGSDGVRTVTEALRPARNRTEVINGVMHIYAEDDLTESHAMNVTTAPSDPISGIAPIP